MDSTLRLPLALYVVTVVLFPAPGIVILWLEGHGSSAFLFIVGVASAVGMGRVLLWRRMGRPALPARRSRSDPGR